MSELPKGRKSPPYSLHLCNGIVTIMDPKQLDGYELNEQEACRRILAFPPEPLKYDYAFTLWPDETRFNLSVALFDVFRLLNTRVEMTFTEAEFEDYRLALVRDGFRLTGVVRVFHHEPEIVEG